MKIFADICADGATSRERIRSNLSLVRHTIAFASLKGGTGKSTLAVNCAVAMALDGRKVAIIDCDLNAPSILPMLAMRAPRSLPMVEGIEPASGPHGLRIVSSAMIPGGDPATLMPFGEDSVSFDLSSNHSQPTATSEALIQMLSLASIGAVDTLIVDLAPGLDHALAIADLVPNTSFVMVTNPSGHSALAAAHGLDAARESHLDVIGVVENMGGFHCDNCRSVRPLWPEGAMNSAVRDHSSRIIGRIPFEPKLAECGDRGAPFVRLYADTPTAHAITEICAQIESSITANSRPAILA